MNKTELIEYIAKHADISKPAATRALESTIGAVKTTLKKGGTVSLVGFGLTGLIMGVLTGHFHAPYLPAQLLTTGIVLFWSFLANRFWTFSTPPVP